MTVPVLKYNLHTIKSRSAGPLFSKAETNHSIISDVTGASLSSSVCVTVCLCI